MFDTEGLWGECWKQALAEQGLGCTPAFLDALRGTGGAQVRQAVRDFYGPQYDGDALLARAQALAGAVFAAGVPKKPGLDALTAWLAAQHIPMAVASSSPAAIVRGNLRHAGLEGLFAAVITGEDAARAKPAPDIFLKAARALGVPPARCLVLEDSFNGVRAGRAGGFVTVMVPDRMAPDAEMASLYTACLPGLADVRAALAAGTLG